MFGGKSTSVKGAERDLGKGNYYELECHGHVVCVLHSVCVCACMCGERRDFMHEDCVVFNTNDFYVYCAIFLCTVQFFLKLASKYP